MARSSNHQKGSHGRRAGIAFLVTLLAVAPVFIVANTPLADSLDQGAGGDPFGAAALIIPLLIAGVLGLPAFFYGIWQAIVALRNKL